MPRWKGEKVVLLIDNFSAHESGLKFVNADDSQKDVRVIFLPVNVTSVCLPLDQGIIRSLKAHYRHYSVQYIVNEYSAERDPKKIMLVLLALQLGIYC